MDLTLLSGVVRNRKQMTGTVSRSQALFEEGQTESQTSHNTIDRLRTYISKNSIFRKFHLRVHKFTFQWELALHLVICIMSLTPFFFTGKRSYSLIPISVWLFYNILFLIGPQFSNKVIPRFGKLKLSFKSTIEDFFSPKLLPVLSISFLCVVLSLAVTGHRLGGPPLCYHPCGVCLAAWQHSIPLSGGTSSQGGGMVAAAVATVADALLTSAVPEDPLVSARVDPLVDAYHIGCGYANGKEMLAYYTMSQTSFTLFFIVVVALTVCLAWRVAEDERQERRSAEEWLKCENAPAYQLRTQLVEQLGAPGSSVRPEGSATWIFFGVTAALTFTLLGWHNWSVLPPSNTATLLIILNLLTILMSTLILHLSFFGRLLALYKRNYLRVQALTQALAATTKEELDSWWNCRNFVLNDDLSLDYDMGGLAVSATFLIALTLFAALITQIYREGLQTMLEPPGSYLAYACMYITCCLIKLFTLATNTYEEQHRHIAVLQSMSNSFHYQGAMSTDYNEYGQLKSSAGNRATLSGRSGQPELWAASDDSDAYLTGEGALLIEDDEELAGIKLTTTGTGATTSIASGHHYTAAAASTTTAVNPTNPNRPASPASSPRRGGLKGRGGSAVGSLAGSYDSGDKLPGGILKSGTPSGGGNTTPSNWLGKSIFSSFKVGFERSVSGGDEGRDTGNEGSGNITTSAEAAVVGGLKGSGGSGLRLSVLGDTTSAALPRPVHTDTDTTDPTAPDSVRGIAGANSSKISPLGGTKTSFFDASGATGGLSLEGPEKLASHDSFSGVNVNTPPTALTTASVGGGGGGGQTASFALRHSNSGAGLSKLSGNAMMGTSASSSAPPRPALSRSVSHNASVESYRQTIAEIISQIRRYDPYPCILGIPIMPALFNSSKFYIFIGFMLIGMRIMVACLRQV